jgi:hypothetical protein
VGAGLEMHVHPRGIGLARLEAVMTYYEQRRRELIGDRKRKPRRDSRAVLFAFLRRMGVKVITAYELRRK